MRGIDIARAYWEQWGKPMLEERFPELLPLVAAGLCGSGSECFGFDDALSRDHDFEPGLCLFLPGEDRVDRRTAFLLERAYDRLPRSFMGLKRGLVRPVGGARRGVMRTGDYFTDKCGAPDGILTVGQWLATPSHALAEAVNGEIFYDGPGEVTAIRERLRRYPLDIRLKKLAGNLLLMEQAGQYNYNRCLAHGETGAAQLAAVEYANHAMAAIFLLNEVYQPFYKWHFRALRGLERLASLAEPLEYLISTPNDEPHIPPKREAMEDVAASISIELRAQGLSRVDGNELERHAYSINGVIADADLRNAHILAAV